MPAPGGHEFEDRIREFLSRAGFSDVPNYSPHETFELGGQEIDAFGRYSDLYVVVDAKTSRQPSGSGIQAELDRINGYKGNVEDGIKEKYGREHGCRGIIFIYWTKNRLLDEQHIQQAKRYGIALRDFHDLDTYMEALDILQNQDNVRNAFLTDLSKQTQTQIFQSSSSINVPAIKVERGGKTLYAFSMQAKKLLELSYVFRVDTNSLLASYQRLLSEKKIRKIAEYLQQGGYFANNIIVAADGLSFSEEGQNEAPAKGKLELKDAPCSLEVIDGQHRLMAYARLHGERLNDCLFVTAIGNLDKVERAKLFLTVNKEQTKVPPDLLWDLRKLVEPGSESAKIVETVERLNSDGPLMGLIKLPRKRSDSSYLSFSNLCSSLSDNGLYSRYGGQSWFYHMLKGLFEAVKRCMSEDWERSVSKRGKRGFACTNNALSIYLRLLHKILDWQEAEPRAFPAMGNMEEWSGVLREKVAPKIKEHFDKAGSGPQGDPYSNLRRSTTNNSARDKAAEEILKSIRASFRQQAAGHR